MADYSDTSHNLSLIQVGQIPAPKFIITDDQLQAIIKQCLMMVPEGVQRLDIGIRHHAWAYPLVDLLRDVATRVSELHLYGLADEALPPIEDVYVHDETDTVGGLDEWFFLIHADAWSWVFVAQPTKQAGVLACTLTSQPAVLDALSNKLGNAHKPELMAQMHYDNMAQLLTQMAAYVRSARVFTTLPEDVSMPLGLAWVLETRAEDRWELVPRALTGIIKGSRMTTYYVHSDAQQFIPVLSSGQDMVATSFAEKPTLDRVLQIRALAQSQNDQYYITALPIQREAAVWGVVEINHVQPLTSLQMTQLHLMVSIIAQGIERYQLEDEMSLDLPTSDERRVTSEMQAIDASGQLEPVTNLDYVSDSSDDGDGWLEAEYASVDAEAVYWPEIEEFERAGDASGDERPQFEDDLLPDEIAEPVVEAAEKSEVPLALAQWSDAEWADSPTSLEVDTGEVTLAPADWGDVGESVADDASVLTSVPIPEIEPLASADWGDEPNIETIGLPVTSRLDPSVLDEYQPDQFDTVAAEAKSIQADLADDGTDVPAFPAVEWPELDDLYVIDQDRSYSETMPETAPEEIAVSQLEMPFDESNLIEVQPLQEEALTAASYDIPKPLADINIFSELDMVPMAETEGTFGSDVEAGFDLTPPLDFKVFDSAADNRFDSAPQNEFGAIKELPDEIPAQFSVPELPTYDFAEDSQVVAASHDEVPSAIWDEVEADEMHILQNTGGSGTIQSSAIDFENDMASMVPDEQPNSEITQSGHHVISRYTFDDYETEVLHTIGATEMQSWGEPPNVGTHQASNDATPNSADSLSDFLGGMHIPSLEELTGEFPASMPPEDGNDISDEPLIDQAPMLDQDIFWDDQQTEVLEPITPQVMDDEQVTTSHLEIEQAGQIGIDLSEIEALMAEASDFMVGLGQTDAPSLEATAVTQIMPSIQPEHDEAWHLSSDEMLTMNLDDMLNALDLQTEDAPLVEDVIEVPSDTELDEDFLGQLETDLRNFNSEIYDVQALGLDELEAVAEASVPEMENEIDVPVDVEASVFALGETVDEEPISFEEIFGSEPDDTLSEVEEPISFEAIFGSEPDDTVFEDDAVVNAVDVEALAPEIDPILAASAEKAEDRLLDLDDLSVLPAAKQTHDPDNVALPPLVLMKDFRVFLSRVRERVQRVLPRQESQNRAQAHIANQLMGETDTALDILSDLTRVVNFDEIDQRRFDLTTVLKDVLNSKKKAFAERSIDIVLEPTNDLAVMEGDRTMMMQGLSKLFDGLSRLIVGEGDIEVVLDVASQEVQMLVTVRPTHSTPEQLQQAMRFFSDGVPKRNDLALAHLVVLHHEGTITAHIDSAIQTLTLTVQLALVE